MSLRPPLAGQLSPNNDGPAVITVAYALIIVVILGVVVRVLTTFTLKRQFGWDDSLLVVAVAIGLAQSILVEKSALHGLGRHLDALGARQRDLYYKYSYTANLLSMFAQAAAKSSLIHLMSRLSANQSRMQKIYLGAHGVVFAWLIFSVFSLAFQCDTPRWVYTKESCTGEGALWYPVLILNMLTDLVLSVLFAPTVWKLQMPVNQRTTVMALFGVRVTVCIATIAQLATLAPALRKDDITRAMTVPVILGQVVMNLSILTAAAPSLHRFLNELHMGQGFASALPTSKHDETQNSKGTKSWGKIRSAVKKRSTTNMGTGAERTFDDGRGGPEFRPDTNRGANFIGTEPHKRTEAGSEMSGDGSEDMIIRQTKEYTVSYGVEGGPHHPQTHAI